MARLSTPREGNACPRNRIQASSAVNTAYKFGSSEAVDAALVTGPYISATGPATPPKTIALASQSHSPRRGRLIELIQ